ncbi:unnamed protein product [Camellia sinensis]
MDKHRCKLCFKSFINGRALGGHMRSHMLNLYVPPKPEQQSQQQPNEMGQLGEETESASSSSSSSSSSSEEENDEKALLSYGLRENPKKSIRLVDPEFSFAVDAAGSGGSVILQDRESETESSKNPIRRRSKRIRRSGIPHHNHHCQDQKTQKESPMKRPKSGKLGSPEQQQQQLPPPPCTAEPEAVSSISDTTPEEDVAYCLIMMSRDKWMRDEEQEPEPDYEDDDDDDDETEESDEIEVERKQSKANKISRAKYKCETCHKVFRSYQALGGHRASHKKARAHNNGVLNQTHEASLEVVENRNVGVSEGKIHECPVCYRVFSSGQALGGHKRSHVTGSSTTITTTTINHPPKQPLKSVETLIDLNLPAPIDDDELSQIELSAVSDAEFVNQFKH